ncbi:hypothetical protein EVAR_36964_1 [Eumeta japonica]|uniref:Uncharacterized protein n=1 Tax=Eumeta variegata TaxID=151549 RepID=A0A4C1W9C4_EUMVA|nr:hypothetical protein EVAR_36964_1 [Eumeta japonica]
MISHRFAFPLLHYPTVEGVYSMSGTRVPYHWKYKYFGRRLWVGGWRVVVGREMALGFPTCLFSNRMDSNKLRTLRASMKRLLAVRLKQTNLLAQSK